MVNLTEEQKAMREYLVRVIAEEMTTLEAAMQSGLTQRAIQQKVRRFRANGEKSLIHGNTGKKKTTPEREELKKAIADIFLNTRIDGMNPFEDITYTYFTEILAEEYKIKASVGWVKKILRELGYRSPIKHTCRNRKIFLMRERKEHTGELVQADGTPYDWFKDGHLYCIQGFVDDATGYPTGLYMTKNECTLGYMESFRIMAENDGIPEQMYTDKSSVFFVNSKTKDDSEVHLTQFGLMMENLGVDMFPAHSPQAKGRIERFWQTIQHRLPNLFRLRGIRTVQQANEFLRNDFLRIYKRWFPVKPKSDESNFVKADMTEVNSILKATFPGKTDKAGVFSLKGYRFFCPSLPDRKILIHLNEKEGLWITTTDSTERHTVKLVETDTTGNMPEVMKDLIERVFLKNAKPRFREVYFDIDEVILSQVKPKKRLA